MTGWLALLTGFLAVLILPTAIYEYLQRSEYRAFCRYRDAIKSQREDYVAPSRATPEHPRTIVRAGVVK